MKLMITHGAASACDEVATVDPAVDRTQDFRQNRAHLAEPDRPGMRGALNWPES